MRKEMDQEAIEAREEAAVGDFSEEDVEAEAENLGRSTRHTRSFRGISPTKCL
jgi:hypothetical protein